MKFNIENAPVLENQGLCVGAVYPSYNKRYTSYWVVLAVHENGATVLGLNKHGEITCARDYALHVFNGGDTWEGRKKIGQCRNFGLTFDIDWGVP